MGIYESCRALGVDFRGVELGDWLDVPTERVGVPSEEHHPETGL